MKIAGFEGLMRWRHPVNGMISPGVFIPVAEDSGLITELSQLALESGSDAAIKLQAAASKDLIGPEPLFVGVNFSVKDFSAVDLPGILQAAIEQKQMNPLQIHLEIVESLLMDSPEKARAVLEKCREIGINISIDDFGSGYSSLSYLHFFPIDTLKIDQSFIRTLSKDQGSKVLVKAIIGLAHNLGMKVIAEGVETAADAEYILVLYWLRRRRPRGRKSECDSRQSPRRCPKSPPDFACSKADKGREGRPWRRL